MLYYGRQHSEITALCRLWLCDAKAFDKTNNRADYSTIGEQSFIRSEPIPIYRGRYRFRGSTEISVFSSF